MHCGSARAQWRAGTRCGGALQWGCHRAIDRAACTSCPLHRLPSFALRSYNFLTGTLPKEIADVANLQQFKVGLGWARS